MGVFRPKNASKTLTFMRLTVKNASERFVAKIWYAPWFTRLFVVVYSSHLIWKQFCVVLAWYRLVGTRKGPPRVVAPKSTLSPKKCWWIVLILVQDDLVLLCGAKIFQAQVCVWKLKVFALKCECKPVSRFLCLTIFVFYPVCSQDIVDVSAWSVAGSTADFAK